MAGETGNRTGEDGGERAGCWGQGRLGTAWLSWVTRKPRQQEPAVGACPSPSWAKGSTMAARPPRGPLNFGKVAGAAAPWPGLALLHLPGVDSAFLVWVPVRKMYIFRLFCTFRGNGCFIPGEE